MFFSEISLVVDHHVMLVHMTTVHVFVWYTKKTKMCVAIVAVVGAWIGVLLPNQLYWTDHPFAICRICSCWKGLVYFREGFQLCGRCVHPPLSHTHTGVYPHLLQTCQAED